MLEEKGVDAAVAVVGGWDGYLGVREGICKEVFVRIPEPSPTHAYTQTVLSTMVWVMTLAMLLLIVLLF